MKYGWVDGATQEARRYTTLGKTCETRREAPRGRSARAGAVTVQVEGRPARAGAVKVQVEGGSERGPEKVDLLLAGPHPHAVYNNSQFEAYF